MDSVAPHGVPLYGPRSDASLLRHARRGRQLAARAAVEGRLLAAYLRVEALESELLHVKELYFAELDTNRRLQQQSWAVPAAPATSQTVPGIRLPMARSCDTSGSDLRECACQTVLSPADELLAFHVADALAGASSTDDLNCASTVEVPALEPSLVATSSGFVMHKPVAQSRPSTPDRKATPLPMRYASRTPSPLRKEDLVFVDPAPMAKGFPIDSARARLLVSMKHITGSVLCEDASSCSFPGAAAVSAADDNIEIPITSVYDDALKAAFWLVTCPEQSKYELSLPCDSSHLSNLLRPFLMMVRRDFAIRKTQFKKLGGFLESLHNCGAIRILCERQKVMITHIHRDHAWFDISKHSSATALADTGAFYFTRGEPTHSVAQPLNPHADDFQPSNSGSAVSAPNWSQDTEQIVKHIGQGNLMTIWTRLNLATDGRLWDDPSKLQAFHSRLDQCLPGLVAQGRVLPWQEHRAYLSGDLIDDIIRDCWSDL